MNAPRLRPAGVAQVVADICRDCPTPCPWRDCAEAHANACLACPLGRWGQWGACSDSARDQPQPAPRGLGDVVAIVAAPVGVALGLDPARCGCAARQAGLNAAVPFRPDADAGVVL